MDPWSNGTSRTGTRRHSTFFIVIPWDIIFIIPWDIPFNVVIINFNVIFLKVLSLFCIHFLPYFLYLNLNFFSFTYYGLFYASKFCVMEYLRGKLRLTSVEKGASVMNCLSYVEQRLSWNHLYKKKFHFGTCTGSKTYLLFFYSSVK